MSMNTEHILQLRQMTGAGMNDCRQALEEAQGDIEKAVEILRKKGALKAAKKSATRLAGQGLVEAYVHANGLNGALVEVRCETDFVARNKEFKNLAHDIAMQVSAMNPLYVKTEDVPSEVIEKEKEIYREEIKESGKPEQVVEKIIEGKLKKYYEDVCLLNQPFIKDDKMTVKELIDRHIAKLGEKIEVTRFTRFNI